MATWLRRVLRRVRAPAATSTAAHPTDPLAGPAPASPDAPRAELVEAEAWAARAGALVRAAGGGAWPRDLDAAHRAAAEALRSTAIATARAERVARALRGAAARPAAADSRALRADLHALLARVIAQRRTERATARTLH